MKSTSFYSYLLIAVLSSQTKKTEWRNSGRNFKKLFVLTNACRCANNQVSARLLYYLLIPGMKWIFITCIDRHYGVIKCCTDYQGPPMSTYRTDKKQTATVIYRTNFITFAECDDWQANSAGVLYFTCWVSRLLTMSCFSDNLFSLKILKMTTPKRNSKRSVSTCKCFHSSFVKL
jgi:hypothetical protein